MRKRRPAARHGVWLLFLLASALLPPDAAAQSGAFSPSVHGAVAIGLSQGAVAGDVCLSPEIPRDTLTIVLNRSLTIDSIRGGHLLTEESVEQPGGAAIRHRLVLPRPVDDAPAEPVCIVYHGTESVHDIRREQFREMDASEVIAFNGSTVRARGSSRWYPAIYDPVTDLTSEAESFRLTIRCDECQSIFLNGAAPATGPIATLEAAGRRELLLLAGDFPIRRLPGALVIGEAAPLDSLTRFVDMLTEIRRFQEAFTGVPFGDDLVLLRVEPVRRPREGLLWGFYSHPTLALLGMTMGEFVEAIDNPSRRESRAILGLMGHELAHRYFAWTHGWRSPQRDLFGEPFATYLELKTIRHFLGEAPYRAALQSLARRVSDSEPAVPLHESAAIDYAYNSYRYVYAPLQLFALEGIIGELRMRTLLRAMLEAPEEERADADVDFIRRTASHVGILPEEWSIWINECLEGGAAEGRCFERVLDEENGR